MLPKSLTPDQFGHGMAEQEAGRSGLKLAGVFVLVSAMLVGAGSLYLSRVQTQARAAAQKELSAIADLKLEQISKWRLERIADARFFSRARFVANDLRYLADNPGSEQAKAAVLDWLQLLKGGERYKGVAVFSAAGDRVLAIPPSINEPRAYIADLIAQAEKQHDIVVTDLHRDESGGFVHLDLLVPIFENADWSRAQPFGYVLLKVDASQFLFPVVQTWPMPSQTAEILLIRREGDSVLYLNELRHRSGAALNFKLPLSTPDLPAAQFLSGNLHIVEGRDYRGVRVVAAGRLVPDTAWAIVSKVDREEIYAPLRKQTLSAMAAMGALLLAGASLVAFLWRQRSARFLRHELAQREKHAREIERMNRLYAALSRINQAVVRGKAIPELLEQICAAFVEAGGCRMAWVGWRDDTSGRILPLAQSGDEDGHLRQVEFWTTPKAELETCIEAAIRHGRPCVCNNLHTSPLPPICARGPLPRDCQALAAFPIKQEDQVRGVLAVYASQEDFFGPQEQSLIAEAAEDVSFGLDSLLGRERRERAEEALRRSEEQLRVAALAAEIGVWTWTPGTSQAVVSANWRRLFGVGPEEPVSYETWRALLHPEDRDRVLNELTRAAQEDRDYRCEYRVVRPDGTTRWILDRGRTFYDEAGKPVGMAGVNADITERKQAEQLLRDTRDDLARANIDLERKVQERTAQLVEANASLQSFAYTAAHDLRSPLRSIRSFSGLVRSQFSHALGTEGESLLSRVQTSAEQMDRLLNDLLEYSRMSQAELKLTTVDLKVAVTEALALLDGEVCAKAASVTVSDSLPAVKGHPATVALLINNFVSNALKFVPADVAPRIRIWAEPRSGTVTLFVEDNGIGIAAEDLGGLFEPFHRLHGKQTYPGTGLGLAIVRKGAERMGGRVGVESQLGKGSRFWLKLPLASPAALNRAD